MSLTIVRAAEWVLPGHPDKLADAIADAIVAESHRRGRYALAGIEVAVHRDVVFIDGRVACQDAKSIDVASLVRAVYASAGYGRDFAPDPRRLKIRTDLDLGDLVPDEDTFRAVADDQVIVTGYACSLPGTGGLPVEQALAHRLGRALFDLRTGRPDLRLGPDGKLIVFIEDTHDARRLRLREVSLSLQHAPDWDPIAVRRAVTDVIVGVAKRSSSSVPGFSGPDDALRITINPIGDFVCGGPHGDNGLSGKKLVMDYYGPRVPIGGGALSGKDFWKADRAGAITARRLALQAVERLGLREVFVTLAIRPGDTCFEVLRAEAPLGSPLNPARFEGLADLRLDAVRQRMPAKIDLVSIARFGHFTGGGSNAVRSSSSFV